MKKEWIVKEALRYTGMPYEEADEQLRLEVYKLYEALESVCQPKWVYQQFEVELEDDWVYFKECKLSIQSKDLTRLLKNCKTCYVLAVTLGREADLLIRQKQHVSMSEALLVDTCASVYIEQVCDEVEAYIIKELGVNKYMTMRYSPGYGDVPLDVQKDLIEVIQAPKRIGLNLTRSEMLIPTKSVTAFIGVSSKKENRHKTCNQCMLQTTCMYRERGERCGN